MANKARYPLTYQFRKREGHSFRLLLRIVTVLTLLSAVGMTWVFYRDLTTELPSVDRLAHYVAPAATRVYADDGTLIGEFYMEKRYPLPLTRIPLLVQQAFLAAEDADFYSHWGVNPAAVLRAFMSNWSAGHTTQGGSTITQQVVRALLLTREKSYRRKVQEIILAFRLERHLSKSDILSVYLNE